MSYAIVFNYLTVTALAVMSFGILEQWWRTYKTRSAEDIVSTEVIIRFMVTLILFIKLWLVGDVFLIIGQTILLSAITLYAATLLYYKITGVTE